MNELINSSTIGLDEIEKGIVGLLETVGSKIHCKSNSESTSILKTEFIQLGSCFNFETCPCDYNSEFLYDVLWYKNETHEFESMKSVPLVLESEWDKRFSQIQFDFEKLLIAKSKYKVMIFQSDVGEYEISSKLIKIINNYDTISKNEKYILACFDNSIGNFKIRIYSK